MSRFTDARRRRAQGWRPAVTRRRLALGTLLATGLALGVVACSDDGPSRTLRPRRPDVGQAPPPARPLRDRADQPIEAAWVGKIHNAGLAAMQRRFADVGTSSAGDGCAFVTANLPAWIDQVALHQFAGTDPLPPEEIAALIQEGLSVVDCSGGGGGGGGGEDPPPLQPLGGTRGGKVPSLVSVAEAAAAASGGTRRLGEGTMAALAELDGALAIDDAELREAALAKVEAQAADLEAGEQALVLGAAATARGSGLYWSTDLALWQPFATHRLGAKEMFKSDVAGCVAGAFRGFFAGGAGGALTGCAVGGIGASLAYIVSDIM